MQRKNWYVFVAAAIVGLTLAACDRQSNTTENVKPAKVEHLEGTDLSRLILTAKAAERLDIKTAAVREARVVRKRTVGGEVMAVPTESTMVVSSVSGTISTKLDDGGALVSGAYLSAGDTVLRLSPFAMASNQNEQLLSVKAPHSATLIQVHVELGQNVMPGQALFEVADLSSVWVRVPIVGDPSKVARDQPALVLPLIGDDEASGLTAWPVQGSKLEPSTLHYVVSGTGHGLVPRQRVRVEISLSGSGTLRKVIPYASVLYKAGGDTWVYTNPEPLVFVRHRISINYIDGDLAVLSDGPPSGTAVVTTGAAELFGLEFGVGK